MKSLRSLLAGLTLAVALAAAAPFAHAQPVITVQPRNQTNLIGTTATFTVEATGTAPLAYQWRSHATLTSFTNIFFGTTPALTLTNVEPTSRRFAVVVTDGAGLSLTSTPLVTLTVLTPPVITQQPTNYFVFVNGPASLYVAATGTGPLRYQWMFNSPTNPVPGATNSSLLFSNLRPNQTGNYYVVVTNVIGAVTSSVARVGFFWAPTTGTDIPALAKFDTNIQEMLFRYRIPGAGLAIVKNGRLVFARGYGYANTNTGELVQPDSLFRLASLSKPITAAATLKLVEEGKLSLSNSAFGLLQYPTPSYAGSTNDPRLGQITVRHLLSHTSGWWPRDGAPRINGGFGPFDPSYWFARPATDLGIQGPLSRADQVRWFMGMPLRADPGTAYAYSNVGYLTLGRLIEKVTGLTYEDYVRSVLKPIGITRIRVTADNPSALRFGQVMNYDYARAQENEYFADRGYEIPPGDDSLVYALPFSIRDSAAAMIASPIDYLRFVTAVDGQTAPPDILSASTVNSMFTPSAPSIATGDNYGLGWHANYPGPGDCYHDGYQIGVRSLVYRLANGISCMYVFNFNPEYRDSSFDPFMFDLVTGSLGNITSWPTNDFFPTTLSYDAWRDSHFTTAELASSALSGDRADPDGDGSPNLFEYATGSDPRDPASDRQPSGSFVTVDSQSYFALTFRRLILGYEVNYVVEASSDLVSWSPVNDPVGTPQLNPDGTQTVTFRDAVPKNAGGQRFLRLRISRQAQDR